jgi:hypothetical protein
MSGVTVAIGAVAAAGIGAAGSIIAGQSAGNAIRSSTNASIAEQQQAQAEQQKLLAPYQQAGAGALNTLTQLTTPGANQEATLASLPGYQFAKTEGLTATENAATSMGLGLSGNTLRGLDTFASGLADQTWGQEVNAVQGVANMGEAAAAGQANNIGNAANNISSLTQGAGVNIANIDINTIAGISKALGGAANTAITSQTLASLLQQGSGGGPG